MYYVVADKSKLSIAPVEQSNKTPTNSTHNNMNKAQTVPDLIKYGKMHEENNSNLHDMQLVCCICFTSEFFFRVHGNSNSE